MKPNDHFMGHPGLHGHCEPAPPMHPHCTPCPPAPPMHPHCHPAPPMPLCQDIHDLDYARLHELVLKIYRFCTSLKERLDVLDPNGDGTGNGNGGNGCECVVDTQLSATSENAVQNKVIVGAMAEYTDALKQLKDQVDKMKPGIGESDVKSVFKQVFIQMNDKPNRPNGGSYSFETNAFTAPTGWSATTKNFNAENDIWMSYCSFMSDGTDTGWSEPVRLIDYQGVFNKIENDMKDLYNKILDEANKNLDRVWENAQDKLADAKQDIEAAKAQISDAKGLIDQARLRIARLEDGYEFLTKIDDKTLGQLRELAQWVDGNEGTVTTLINDINYIKGEIETHGQWISTKDGVINEVSRKLSAAEGKIEDNATHINTVEGKVNSAGTRIDAVEASVTAQAKAIDTVNNTVGEVKSELVATKAMAQTAASWVDTNQNKVNEAVQRIDGLHAEIVSEVSTAVGNEREHTESYARELLNAEDAAWKVEVAKRYTKEETDQKIAAAQVSVTPEKITAALANNQGAAAAIVAEINKSTSQVSISADKIALNGEVIARLLGTERLVINNGASVFEPDGSGYVAGGNIRWDKDEKITIGNKAITINQDGTLGDIRKYQYVIKTINKENIPNDGVLIRRIGNKIIKRTSAGYGVTEYHYEISGNGGANWSPFSNVDGANYHEPGLGGCVIVKDNTFYMTQCISENGQIWAVYSMKAEDIDAVPSISSMRWTKEKTFDLSSYCNRFKVYDDDKISVIDCVLIGSTLHFVVKVKSFQITSSYHLILNTTNNEIEAQSEAGYTRFYQVGNLICVNTAKQGNGGVVGLSIQLFGSSLRYSEVKHMVVTAQDNDILYGTDVASFSTGDIDEEHATEFYKIGEPELVSLF